MAKQGKGLFGLKLPSGKKLEEVTKRLLEDGSREKTILRGKFDLSKVYGSGTYSYVGKQIEKAGLKKPTMGETASLVYSAFNSYNKHSDEIKTMMRDKWLWAFTGILYVPNEGAYIQDNPEIKDEKFFMDESKLEEKLQKNDQSVRFVPYGYQIKDMTPKELRKNQFVIGLAGEEGAEKLAEVADKHKDKPRLWSFESVDEPLIRVSALLSNWGFGGHRLGVSGDIYDDDPSGCAFGVQKNTKKEK